MTLSIELKLVLCLGGLIRKKYVISVVWCRNAITHPRITNLFEILSGSDTFHWDARSLDFWVKKTLGQNKGDQ